ncbi:MFS transporter [Brucella pseudogrignonensis]|uniref:MFS transporter (Putative signal transducer) n=1 Tax=Brucella pseudogrignonensis TaxID=419475 RepID=A0ABU1MFC7_9HYPH|nr:MFS transporter [Brucella pseudogrignonensis]MDR6434752.1 MFS transporter (putative signal transducer) [Brucella pseudogrignonensis]
MNIEWNNSLPKVSVQRLIIGLGGLYVAQSIIGSMIFAGLPAVMRQSGASLNEIAFTLLAVLPWSLKFLWAPAVERFRAPHGGHRRSRLTVCIVGIFSVGAVVALALTGPTTIGALAVAMMIASSASATIDIACDGHAVESFSEENRGWGNAAQIGGAYLGAALGGGIFLIMLDHWSWRTSSLAMAGLLVLLALPFLLTPDGALAPRSDRPSPSLKNAFKRAEIRSGLILVAVYVFGQKWAMTMIGPFLIDTGMSLTTLGTLNGIGITVLGLVGAVGGGYLVRRFGAYPVMFWTLPAQALAMFSLAMIAYWHIGSLPLLMFTLLISATMFALGFVALYSELMGRASLDQAGVDFTLFQSADAIVSLIGWQLAATAGEVFGYAFCFASASAFGLITLILLPRLREKH